MFQMLSGRLGWNIHDMNRADGLEIYISQGAKPRLGGQLMAKKITPELARSRRRYSSRVMKRSRERCLYSRTDRHGFRPEGARPRGGARA